MLSRERFRIDAENVSFDWARLFSSAQHNVVNLTRPVSEWVKILRYIWYETLKFCPLSSRTLSFTHFHRVVSSTPICARSVCEHVHSPRIFVEHEYLFRQNRFQMQHFLTAFSHQAGAGLFVPHSTGVRISRFIYTVQAEKIVEPIVDIFPWESPQSCEFFYHSGESNIQPVRCRFQHHRIESVV